MVSFARCLIKAFIYLTRATNCQRIRILGTTALEAKKTGHSAPVIVEENQTLNVNQFDFEIIFRYKTIKSALIHLSRLDRGSHKHAAEWFVAP